MKPFWPVDMKWAITQRFGENPQSYKNRQGHPGVDFGTPTDCPLYAACDGTITAAAYRKAGGYGREIFTQSGKWSVIYGHCSEILVSVGDKVRRGDLIGYSGGIYSYGCTWTGGTVTGKRYSASMLSWIYTSGGGENYFPGDVAGTATTGSQYA